MADLLRLVAFDLRGHLRRRFAYRLCGGGSPLSVRPRGVSGAFGNARRLARAASQIIKLRAPHHAPPHHLDRSDAGRVEGKDALHTLPVRYLAQCEIRVHSGILAADADTFEDLDAFALTFDDPDPDPQCVARLELRDWAAGGKLFDLLALELLQKVHRSTSPFPLLSCIAR